MNLENTEITPKPEIAVKGIPASPGVAIGSVFLYSEPTFAPELRTVSAKRIPHEINRFKRAIEASRSYLQKISDETILGYGQEFGEILQTQVSILEDKIFLDEVVQLIREKNYDAAYATFKIFQNKREHFLRLSDDYFRDRAFDIQNLKRLILKKMLGKKLGIKLKERSIVVTDNLSPADTIRLHHNHILGFCTNAGGKNSHTAIVARSLAVPAVVGTEFITNIVKSDDQLILDGNDGIVIINPSPETIEAYSRKQKKFLIVEKDLLKTASQPAVTGDGQAIEVMANIEFVEELAQIIRSGAEGIGLYRTEGLFLGGNGLPTEDQQAENYSAITKSMQPNKVVIRTLDIGGDKLLPELVSLPERNPFLGWRAIRFCLDHKEIFLPQLKAILRANSYGNVHILIPMVSSLEEVRQFRTVLEEAKELLRSDAVEFNPEIKIGMMVEIPSAALLAEHFAREVDFFSIGTNDLIQYTLAVDRANEKLSRLYNHFHPALLQLIKKVIETGEKFGIPVSMCGEMAGDPVAVPLLIGMGLRTFSAAHIVVPEIKNVIRNLSVDECTDLYSKVMHLETASEVKNACENFYSGIFSNGILHSNANNNNGQNK